MKHTVTQLSRALHQYVYAWHRAQSRKKKIELTIPALKTISSSHIWHIVCLISDKLHIITRFVCSFATKKKFISIKCVLPLEHRNCWRQFEWGQPITCIWVNRKKNKPNELYNGSEIKSLILIAFIQVLTGSFGFCQRGKQHSS